MKTITCTKCGGKGIIDVYKHIDDGICYRCKGTGVVTANQNKAKATKIKRMTEQEKAEFEASSIKLWYFLKDYRMTFGKHEGKTLRELLFIEGGEEENQDELQKNIDYISRLTNQSNLSEEVKMIKIAFTIFMTGSESRFERIKSRAKNPRFEENKSLYSRLSGGREA